MYVIGAGIGGLAAAFRLQQAGLQVVVLEASSEVGGRMRTISRDGYLIDIGASFLRTSYRRLIKLAADAGLADQLEPSHDLIGIVREGRVHRLRGGHPSDLVRSPILSWSSKLQALRAVADAHRLRHHLDADDLSGAVAADHESAREYAARRLNPELLDYFIEPFVTTFTSCPPEENSAVSLLRLLRLLMLGGSFCNSRSGIGFLPNGLAQRLDVRRSARVVSVEASPRGVRITWQDAQGTEHVDDAAACVAALPAPQIPPLFPQLDPASREFLSTVRYIPSAHVVLGLARPPQEPAMIVLTPEKEYSDLATVVQDHLKAPGRAPPGKGLISVYLREHWRKRHSDLDDQGLSRLVLQAVDRLLPGVSAQVEMTHVQRWAVATLIRRPGDCHRLQQLLNRPLLSSRIFLAGDWLGVTTTETSVAAGERAAARLLASPIFKPTRSKSAGQPELRPEA